MSTDSPVLDSLDYDVVIVGAGPAGLSAAIAIKQLAQKHSQEISVCVLEKAAEIGAHILSGAVFDPRALDELIPRWQDIAPAEVVGTPVSSDNLLILSEGGSFTVPHSLVPRAMRNDGLNIIRLGLLVKWLGTQAEALGVEIFAGFSAHSLIIEGDTLLGVVTGEVGLNRDGSKSAHYQPGMEIRGKYTLLAEGCRGHLGKVAETAFNLRDSQSHQSYGLGIKELWEVTPENSHPGLVVHSAGWPMDNATYGGGFMYHLSDRLVAVGFVTGLGYQNPTLSPFEEFQRYKTHPALAKYLQGGKRLSYGARAIAAGGLQSLPKLVFNGGALIGDDAGFLNPARIKGSHTAIKSGHLCGEAVFSAINNGRAHDTLTDFPKAFADSWLYHELYQSRNFKPYFHYGFWLGSLLFGIDQMLFLGRVPWSLKNHADYLTLKPMKNVTAIRYPKPDGRLTFDRLSSVFLSNTNHAEEQPCHLQLKNTDTPININLAHYGAPETRYCPAGVYEIVGEVGSERLQINAQNCIHCKTCDIKDPTQNINWVTPQGGEGPIYQGM